MYIIFTSQLPHMALRQPYLGFKPAFSANSRIVRFSVSVQVAVVLDWVKVMVARPVSSMSTMMVVVVVVEDEVCAWTSNCR